MQIKNFGRALNLLRIEGGEYPVDLEALRVKPDNLPNWAGPYLPQDIPLDPWGREYLYKYPGDHGDVPDIVSLGADGVEGGEGTNADIVSWKNR
jgi:general secretion pathway protein G